MTYRERYQQWLESPIIDEKTKAELRELEGNEKEIEERFYRTLEFGTGGLRGIIGAGTNRMNQYTVMRATQGLANYILKQGTEAVGMGVAIAHDSRRCSDEYAEVTARVLAANGIKAYLFSELQPTPVLSFTVRALKCTAGVVITASHNPKEYNGYKAYWADGGQLVPEPAEAVIREVEAVNGIEDVKLIELDEAQCEGLIAAVPDAVLEDYITRVCALSIDRMAAERARQIKVVYTPLHGAGNIPVRRVLEQIGFTQVHVVPEQEKPDTEFSTVASPNPENPEAFALAIEQAKEVDADVIVGTDPDADRVGVVIRNASDSYVVLDGNQTGALLIDYVLRAKKEMETLPRRGVLIKTVVTSELGAVIAKDYGIEVEDTLTGFKFICEIMKELESQPEREFVFGYEESFGYLAGDFVRDKDAVIATMLICEMTAYYKSQEKNLYQALEAIWEKYGAFCETQKAVYMEGKTGMEQISTIMAELRSKPFSEICGKKVVKIEDFKTQTRRSIETGETEAIRLRSSNVLKYWLEDGSWVAARPSGTEPKIKFYFSTLGKTYAEAQRENEALKKAVLQHAGL